MKAYDLIKLLDNTFYDVEFDVFEDTEGLVRVNFVVDIEEDEMTKEECLDILIEASGLLADDTDYETNMKPKLLKVVKFLKEIEDE